MHCGISVARCEYGGVWRIRITAEAYASQHEPSGGGRSISQHRRMYAQARRSRRAAPVEQHVSPDFRRTWVRHSPAEIAAAGCRLGTDVAVMARDDSAIVPSPSDPNCGACAFREPCQAMIAGQDAGLILSSRYRERPPDILEEGRLGGGAWGMGRAPRRRNSGAARAADRVRAIAAAGQSVRTPRPRSTGCARAR